MTERKRKTPIGQSIGGVLFGFEQQVFRNQPPPHELVHKARPDDPVPAGDGTFLTFEVTERGDVEPDPDREPSEADPA
jgi:hypothetical protein